MDRWQVELAIGSKVAIDSSVSSCRLNLGIITTNLDLHLLLLGLYDIMLSMYWLATHQVNIDCWHKLLLCVDDTGGKVEFLRVQRLVSLQMILANQLKWGV